MPAQSPLEDLHYMKAEQKDRDILQDLFSGKDEDTAPAVEELMSLIERYADSVKSESPATRSHKSPPKKKARTRLKKKATHYLSIDTTEALEEAKEEIRTLVSPNLKRLVSKSRIVDLALQYVLNELAEKGPESKLVTYILSERKKK